MALDAVAPPPALAARRAERSACTQLPVLPIVPLALPHLPATAGDGGAGWDEVDVVFVTGDAYVDHPSFAMAHPAAACSRRPASAWRSSASPTGSSASRGGSSAGRGCSSASVPATWTLINHYTANKKVRNDDAYSPGRPDRPAARPGDAALLPACPRGLSRRAGHRRRRRGVAAPAGPLRLLERHGPPFDPARRQGRPRRLRHGRARRSSRSPGGWPPARPCATCATCAAWPIVLGAKRGRLPRSERRSCSPLQLRGGQVPTSTKFVEATQRHPHRHQPAQRQDARAVSTIARPSSSTRRRCRSARRNGPHLRPALHAPAAPDVHRDDPRLRDDQGLGHDHARLLRRLHVLLDHRPPGADHPVAVARIGPGRSCARWRPTRSSRASCRDIGGPTANMYQMRCTRPEVEASASGCRASIRRSASCSAPTTARSSSLMRQSRDRAGHRKVLVASGIRMDLAQLSPEYMDELAGTPRRRPSEGRPRAHRPRRARG